MRQTITQKVLALVLTIAALVAGQSAWAQVGIFTVTNTGGSTFTITRTSNTTATEKVMYRTVSLSAIAGTHFTAASGELTFDADNNTRTVTVTEKTPTADAYKYQTSSSRQYRFEVTDLGGAYMAHCNRSITSGLTSVPSSGAFNVKDITIQSSEYTADDDGYDVNGYKSVSSSAYFTSGNAPKAYLQQVSAELRMTLSFQAKENDDAYEYLQLLFSNTSTCDNRSGCSNGDPGNISLSSYMAGFEMNTGSKDATFRNYTFPILSVGDNASATDPWGYGTKWPLSKQKFNSSRATDGRIVVPMNFSSIVLRLNASGSSGSDEWAVKDVTAHVQAVDATAPTKSGDPVVAPGPYGAGSTVYISVPFSEIVTVSGTPYLHTDWGDYNYFSGSGSNVLTFSGTIPTTSGSNLITRTLNGTITDLAGNALSSTDCYKSFNSVTIALPWGGSGTSTDPYVITRADQLDYMATRVNADYGNDNFSGKYFVLSDDITYSHSIDWNTYSRASSSIENNFTPIGCYGRPFQGHFNGQGHTISGIRVWTEYTLTDNTNESLGLFGFVSGGSVSNVVLRDANIRGLKNMGGIVGYLSGGSVTGCTLYQVLVGSHAKANMATGMGIVAGYVGGTVTDCYYRDCVKGLTYQDGSNDITIMPHPERWDNVYTITTATGVSATYDSGTTITIDDATYYAEGCIFNLAYSGTIETAKVQDGYTNTYTITEGRNTLTHHDHIDATLTLPAADCTVSVRFASAWTGSGTEEAPYVITTPAQLDLLAKMVNGQGGYGYSDFDGVCFQLGNDIEYTATSDWNDATSEESNFTAIGGWRSGTTYNQFKGSFDGDGHTISGIRLYKGESGTANGYQGLFGYVGSGGTVTGVTLADTRITGQISVGGIVGLSYGTVQNCTVAADVLVASNHTGSHYHGGIVGKNYGSVSGCTSSVTLTAAYTGTDEYSAVVGWNDNGGTVENCLALGATIPAMDDYYGVIVGYNISGTLTANHYRYCTVGSTANAVGVGAGKSGGAPTDVDGARSVHNLNLPDGVTASGESVTIGSDTYYAAATDVTLACTGPAPSGYVEPCYYSLDGTNISGSTITMPASDATVALLWTTDYETGHAGTEADPYIISDYPQLELLAGRVNSGNKYSSGKFFKLGADIVCFDGENNHAPIGVHGTYQHFFGTFDGDGHTVSGIRISSSTGYQGLFGNLSGATVKNVTLAGSTIIGRDEVGGIVGYSFVGTFENCRVLGDVTIKANASSADYHGGIVGYIFGHGTVNGCYSAATVTRNNNSNCTNYGGIVGKTDGTISNCIADGAWVIGSEESSSGAIVGTNDGGTLAHNYYYGCSVKSFGNNVGTGSGDVTENDGAVQADAVLSEAETVPTDLSGKVVFRREFTGGKASTVCLPFAHEKGTEGTFYTFSGVQYDDTEGKWKATMTEETAATLLANTPYLFLPAGTEAHTPVLFHGTAGYNGTQVLRTGDSGGWQFQGVYDAKTWTAGDVGNDYGFAATSGKATDGVTDVEAGDFVMLAEGAWIRPMRAYLTYTGTGNPWADTNAPAHRAASDGEMPSRISVILVSADGETTSLTPALSRGEGDWYTLDGRKLQGKPTTKGLYIVNGKKVLLP